MRSFSVELSVFLYSKFNLSNILGFYRGSSRFCRSKRLKKYKKKAKKSFNRNTLIVLALVAVLGFGLGLYFLKSKTPAPVVTTNVQPEKPQPKSVLPNRPEEVWHYIKELETRTVPVDNNPSSVEKICV